MGSGTCILGVRGRGLELRGDVLYEYHCRLYSSVFQIKSGIGSFLLCCVARGPLSYCIDLGTMCAFHNPRHFIFILLLPVVDVLQGLAGQTHVAQAFSLLLQWSEKRTDGVE